MQGECRSLAICRQALANSICRQFECVVWLIGNGSAGFGGRAGGKPRRRCSGPNAFHSRKGKPAVRRRRKAVGPRSSVVEWSFHAAMPAFAEKRDFEAFFDNDARLPGCRRGGQVKSPSVPESRVMLEVRLGPEDQFGWLRPGLPHAFACMPFHTGGTLYQQTCCLCLPSLIRRQLRY
jgi:hypothetical protein